MCLAKVSCREIECQERSLGRGPKRKWGCMLRAEAASEAATALVQCLDGSVSRGRVHARRSAAEGQDPVSRQGAMGSRFCKPPNYLGCDARLGPVGWGPVGGADDKSGRLIGRSKGVLAEVHSNLPLTQLHGVICSFEDWRRVPSPTCRLMQVHSEKYCPIKQHLAGYPCKTLLHPVAANRILYGR